jgi:hypothetical protein
MCPLTEPNVTVIEGDWTEIAREAPYDLLVLDGGGQGKNGGPAADQETLLRPGGTLVIDDLTPASSWPPRYEGHPDPGRMHWLTHPVVDAAEVRLAPDLAALVATRRFPASPGQPGPAAGARPRPGPQSGSG